MNSWLRWEGAQKEAESMEEETAPKSPPAY